MASGGRFSSLLLEGLDEYRRGNMQAAVKAWEEAYTLEPTNPRAREFLHSALERIYAQMGVTKRVTSVPPVRGGEVPLRAPAPAPAPVAASPAPPTESEAVTLMRGATDLVNQKDYAGAIDLLGKVLAIEPNNAEAKRMQNESEAILTQQLEARLGGLAQRPRVLLKPDEIRWLDLDPRAGFVLAQIDGAVSYEDLYAICGLEKLDTVRILSQLIDEKVIGAGKA